MTDSQLSHFPLFESLEDADLSAKIEGLLEVRTVEEGENVFRTGEAPDALYLIEEGSIALYTDEPGTALKVVAQLEPGSLFGEVGVLDDSVRAVSARAVEPARLLALSRDRVRRLVRDHREFGVALVLYAMGDTERSAHSEAELGERVAPRVRVDRTVYLWPEGEQPITVRLENLSAGGACFEGLPAHWERGHELAFSIELGPDSEVLRTRGRVVWRRGAEGGIAFEPGDRRLRERVLKALDRLLTPA